MRLVSLRRKSLLQADLLYVVEPLVRINENPGIIIFLMFPLLLRLKALAEVAVLPKLVKEV